LVTVAILEYYLAGIITGITGFVILRFTSKAFTKQYGQILDTSRNNFKQEEAFSQVSTDDGDD